MKPATIRSFFKRHPAWNIVAIGVLFIAIEGLYSFCSKAPQVDCLAFDDPSFDNWFPYKANQIINFSSTFNNKDFLTIETVFKTKKYRSSVGCEKSAGFNSKEQWNGAFKLYVSFYDFGTNDGLNLSFYDFDTGGFFQENSYEPNLESQKSDFLSSLVINGRSFSNVLQIQRDTNVIKQEGVYKIWLSKQAGLVGYERYPSLEQFVKQ